MEIGSRGQSRLARHKIPPRAGPSRCRIEPCARVPLDAALDALDSPTKSGVILVVPAVRPCRLPGSNTLLFVVDFELEACGSALLSSYAIEWSPDPPAS